MSVLADLEDLAEPAILALLAVLVDLSPSKLALPLAGLALSVM